MVTEEEYVRTKNRDLRKTIVILEVLLAANSRHGSHLQW